MPEWLWAAFWGTVAGSALLLGAATGVLVTLGKWTVASVMAFGSGVLISALSFDLMAGAYRRGGFDSTSAGFLAGAAIYSVANWFLARHGARHRKRSGDKQPSEKEAPGSGMAIAVGALLDGIPESMVIGLSLIGGFGLSSFMAFIGSSSFVYQTHYGLTPTLYSLAFSVNAVGFFGASQATSALVRRFGLNRVVRGAVSGFTAAMVLLFALFLVGVDSLAVLATLMFVAFSFLGLVLPTTSVLAMEEQGEFAGTASALMGTLQTITGAVVMGVVASFFNGTAMPMVAGFAACAVIAFVLTQLTIRDVGERGADREAVSAPAE